MDLRADAGAAIRQVVERQIWHQQSGGFEEMFERQPITFVVVSFLLIVCRRSECHRPADRFGEVHAESVT